MTPPDLATPDARQAFLSQQLQMLNLAKNQGVEMPKTMWAFWDTQPVPKMKEVINQLNLFKLTLYIFRRFLTRTSALLRLQETTYAKSPTHSQRISSGTTSTWVLSTYDQIPMICVDKRSGAVDRALWTFKRELRRRWRQHVPLRLLAWFSQVGFEPARLAHRLALRRPSVDDEKNGRIYFRHSCDYSHKDHGHWNGRD